MSTPTTPRPKPAPPKPKPLPAKVEKKAPIKKRPATSRTKKPVEKKAPVRKEHLEDRPFARDPKMQALQQQLNNKN